MITERELCALLYRADWTQLSLSARVHRMVDYSSFRRRAAQAGAAGMPDWVRPPLRVAAQRAGPQPPNRDATGELLIAPGRRYRLRTADEDGEPVTEGCDGETPWLLTEALAGDEGAETSGIPGPPLPVLLCPGWLLRGFALTVDGETSVSGRPAWQITARLASGQAPDPGSGPGRAEAIVDAGLGILLRCEQTSEGQLVMLDELLDLRPDPPQAADPAQFAAPPRDLWAGSAAGQPPGPAWRAAKTVAGAAAAGLGYAIRHAPRTPPPADTQTAMPADISAPASADGATGEQPASNELIYLLHRAGQQSPGITAEVHQWTDIAGIMARLRPAPGSFGPGLLVEAIGERTGVAHQIARIRVGGAGRYRIDYVSARRPPGQAATVACDGERLWKVYANRVVICPPAPLPREIAGLFDPSWLLRWELTGGEAVMAGGRPGLRITAAESERLRWPLHPLLLPPGEAVVDAGLGYLLRVTSPLGRPLLRFELRDIAVTGPAEPADFRPGIPPGLRTVEATGSALDEAGLPEPIRLAGKAAAEVTRRAAAGASALASFLDAMRGKQPPGQRD